MQNHDFTSMTVSDGTSMDVYAAVPEGKGPFPAIILLQEAFGVNHHIRDVAERLCREGYFVIAPDLFHRTAKRIEIAYSDFDSKGASHYQAITDENLENDLKACYHWLQKQDLVQKDKIASMGFCMGGRVSFIANTIFPLKAAISFYGGGLQNYTHKAVLIQGPHLFFWGGKDKRITQDKIDLIIDAVRKAGKEYTNVVISYADHGFHCNERASYHPLAAGEAWAMSLQFLGNRLKQ